MSLKAPEPKSFFTVEQGTYTGRVHAVEVQDWTQTPDPFGKSGHYTFVFRWRLEGVADDAGQPIILPHYVKFTTGDKPQAKGARAGRLPWLTEITRAFGEPDLEPGDDVDPEMWKGKRARLSILETIQADGTTRNSINAVSALKKEAGKARPHVPLVEEDDEDSIPF